MRITIKSSSNPIEIHMETQSATLGDLLSELSKNYMFMGFNEFFDSEHREIYPGCEVFLNEQSYYALIDGLDTKLKEGDKVEIIQLIMLVGG